MAIETILVAVGREEGDRADRLAAVAAELADSTGADVVVAHAFESQSAADKAADQLDLEGGSTADVVRRLDSVRRITSALQDAGVDAKVDGVVGEPGERISELAESAGADRVIVGGRRRSPTGKAVFGSTAQQIMLSAPCPVTFVRRAE
jgi:nucleotide-binding universal stress UspA family protein